MIETLKEFPDKPARWNVPAEDGRLLYDLILENDYQRVLEVGTSNGYSALWMGFALKQTGGRLITIEMNEERAQEARENIEKAGLSSVIEVRLGNAMDQLPRLSGTFEMVFLDADKSQYLDYFRYIDSLVPDGGTITAHNVSTMAYAMRDFLDALRDHGSYETQVHRESRQGMLVAYKSRNREVQ
jgi:predicted O-methyltransferase YrrM